MPTYAEMWNETWAGPTSSGPTRIIVDGLYEEHAEEEQMMEIEDPDAYYLDDVENLVDGIRVDRTGLNSSSSLATVGAENLPLMWRDEMSMDTDQPSVGALTFVVVVDTNVLLSNLSLLKGLVLNLRPKLDMIMVIPGIVIQELDGLKNSKKEEKVIRPGGKEDKVHLRDMARYANNWLYEQVVTYRNPSIRIQKDFETPRQPNWRLNREGLTNDMLILECADYIRRSYYIDEGNVKLLTSDKNLSLVSQQHGVPPIMPQKQWTTEDLLGNITPTDLTQSDPLGTNGISRSRQSETSHVAHRAPLSPHGTIAEHDMSDPASPAIVGHPLTVLHTQVLEYVEDRLQTMMPQIIEQENRDRSLENPNLSVYARRSFPIPDERTWRNSTRDCIRFVYDVTSSGHASPSSSKRLLSDFLTRPNRPGGRKGEFWGRGDWNAAVEEMRRFFNGDDMDQLAMAVAHTFTLAGQARR